ncbi:MAG: exodeoxyribonuclease VII small subunit [Alphaproteobacteria bacterium]
MASRDKPADVEKLSFEAALAELEEIVRQLEQGKSSLDDAIGAYERGAKLKQHCEKKLNEAKMRVEKITLSPGGGEGLEAANLE